MAYSLSQMFPRKVWLTAVALVCAIPLFSETRDVIVDNAKVRVLRVVAGPGETVERDHPTLDRVVIWLQDGNGTKLLADGKTQEVSWKQYAANWEPANSIRPIRLTSGATVTAIVVELKEKGDARHSPASPQNPWIVDPKHYHIEFENRDVRITRVKIGPKESTPLHEHSLDRVVVYLTGLNFQIDPEGMPAQHSVQEPGAVVWGGPARHMEHNLTDKAFEAVVVEPKY